MWNTTATEYRTVPRVFTKPRPRTATAFHCATRFRGRPLWTLINASDRPASLLLVAREPIGEPVARYGSFVMSTREEIQQAVEDFRQGRMGELEE